LTAEFGKGATQLLLYQRRKGIGYIQTRAAETTPIPGAPPTRDGPRPVPGRRRGPSPPSALDPPSTRLPSAAGAPHPRDTLPPGWGGTLSPIDLVLRRSPRCAGSAGRHPYGIPRGSAPPRRRRSNRERRPPSGPPPDHRSDVGPDSPGRMKWHRSRPQPEFVASKALLSALPPSDPGPPPVGPNPREASPAVWSTPPGAPRSPER